ncbi:MAG TPA: kelch repeat-containing protein [Polyangia bacterium]
MPSSARWLGPLLACAVAACSGNSGPPMRIRLAHAATPDARCFVPGGGPQPDDQQLAGVTLGDLKIDKVRITIREHAAGDVTGTFLCDRMVNVPHDVPSLRIPRHNAQSIDIYAEAWAPIAAGDTIPRRVAVGSLLGVPLTAKTIPDLRLYPDERFRCLNQKMNRPRAFHSATKLPNGQVLVVGGLTPTPDAGDEAFGVGPVYVTSEAEIYDPSTGAFVQVVEDDGPQPRAFHQAAFVGTTDDGRYQVLLVGGATADPTMAAFGINTGAAPGTRLVPFDTSATLINPLPVSAARAELMVYNPADHSATRTAMAGFTPGVFQAGAAFADGIAVAGGIDWKGMPLAATIPTINRAEVSRALEVPRFVALPAARMGATMTALTDDAALVWGGQITPTDPAGEHLAGLSAGAVTQTPVTLATAPPTQFHTATLLPPSPSTTNRTIVITGGFIETTTNMGQALQPPAPAAAARLLTVTTTGTVSQSTPMLSSGYSPDASCMLDNRYRPAGWESAVDLGRGRVLISGGAPMLAGGCNNCDDGGSDFRCSTAQASLFSAPSTISPALEKLQIARYGHSSTLMSDGNVLIVGGVTAAAGNPRILRDVEVYNPRPIVPAFDPATGDPDDPVAADLASTPRTPGAPLNAAAECGVL